MSRVVLASDFHLDPAHPREIEVFVEFLHEIGAGADQVHLLGDLFEFWVGPKQRRVAGHDAIFAAMRELSRGGTKLVLYHGNRDFLLGATEAGWVEGSVVGEEGLLEVDGKRFLLLHGDSLCTLDVGYQKTKPILRSRFVRVLSHVLPLSTQLKISGRLRGESRKTVASKSREVMELVRGAVAARFDEGYDALICGHVHAPGERDYGTAERPLPVYVLGDWHDGGVYGVIEAGEVRLERFYPRSATLGVSIQPPET